ncbi:DNA polymerase IV [Dorea acetigenes]|uniref:DNA polymerase IV n=1 Tax=Dorea acetigenes TaxID=2981787 RepID=A0ABT2RSG9_9FIRM|nr:DNA polymerase IV [Dorea acetigenes]MCB6415444.1 DNA polymerase IV [Faecalimonas umbilicata]MCU6688333.1 DNA polymerase IV [Dorea acetigenes]
MMSIIFHIDVNSAYLSWTAVEELKNGGERDLRMIPAIIGGNQESRHGVVLAKSLPAKKYGIRTGEPVANAFRKCPNLVMEPPNHKMYSEYSHRLMEFLRTYTPDIEQVSVDECYMDFTGIAHRFYSPVEGALEIKNRIYEKFGFTVNIGISVNKLLAKMASDFEKPNRVHTLFPEEIQLKMWPLPVSELYMAGRSSVEQLKKLEIHTIGDLAQMNPEILELHLKSHGRMLWESANGRGDDSVVSVRVDAKGIGNSVTLPKDVVTREEAKEVLLHLAESVGARLREAGQKAGMLSVEIRYHTFENSSHQRQLFRATSNDSEIYHIAVELFDELWDKRPVRLLGIRSSKLQKEDEPEQLSIFDIQREQKDAARTEKQKRLDKALDEIRKKYGEDAVKRGRFL